MKNYSKSKKERNKTKSKPPQLVDVDLNPKASEYESRNVYFRCSQKEAIK